MDFNKIFEIMSDSFPKNEMRTYDEQKKLLNNDKHHIYTEYDTAGKLIGFLAYWNLKCCLFFEHLAVLKNLRGKGIGAKIISKHINNAKKPIFLEVEPPVTDITKRRINFYKRLGFHLNEFYYKQPALRTDGIPQHLMIMSYPKPISENDFIKYKNEIYTNVYNI